MSVDLDPKLADGLRRLAIDQGIDLDSLINEVMSDYLDMRTLPDVCPDDVATVQLELLSELDGLPPFDASQDGAP